MPDKAHTRAASTANAVAITYIYNATGQSAALDEQPTDGRAPARERKTLWCRRPIMCEVLIRAHARVPYVTVMCEQHSRSREVTPSHTLNMVHKATC